MAISHELTMMILNQPEHLKNIYKHNYFTGKFRHEFANLFTCNCWRKRKYIGPQRHNAKINNNMTNLHKNHNQARKTRPNDGLTQSTNVLTRA